MAVYLNLPAAFCVETIIDGRHGYAYLRTNEQAVPQIEGPQGPEGPTTLFIINNKNHDNKYFRVINDTAHILQNRSIWRNTLTRKGNGHIQRVAAWRFTGVTLKYTAATGLDFDYQVINTESNKKNTADPNLKTKTTQTNNLELVLRNTDIQEKKLPKGFNYLINNCIKEETYEEPENVKYDRLLFSRNSYSSSGGKEDENIDAMIESIKKDIANIKRKPKRLAKRKNTMILYTTIFRSYNLYNNRINEQDFLDSEYEKLKVTKFLTDCNKELEKLNTIDKFFQLDNFLHLIKSKM